jgi:hypothetical protein
MGEKLRRCTQWQCLSPEVPPDRTLFRYEGSAFHWSAGCPRPDPLPRSDGPEPDCQRPPRITRTAEALGAVAVAVRIGSDVRKIRQRLDPAGAAFLSFCLTEAYRRG